MAAYGWKPRDADVLTALDDRKISLFRIGLAISSLLIVAVGAEPDPQGRTLLALTLYSVYSAVIYGITRRYKLSWKAFVATLAVDIAVATLLIAIDPAVDSGFFFFYYFPIIVGGMRGGSAFGFGVTTVAAFLFTTLATRGAADDNFELGRFLIRPLYLIGLGYVISLWAGAEILLKRKLALLRELSLTTNPRLNADRIIGDFVERLLQFYEARACVLALANPEGEGYRLYRVYRQGTKIVSESVDIRNESECPLLAQTRYSAGVYRWREGFRISVQAEDYFLPGDPEWQEMRRASGQTAEWLDARSFITAPMRLRNKALGQICLTSSLTMFEPEDAIFLQQIVDQMIPVLENVRLVDRLATEAAGQERGRIARSIHDRVIQPYLGLQMGLDAARQSLRVELGQAAAAGAVTQGMKSVELLERLSVMTREGVEELRDYVNDLRRPDARRARLVDSMRRFASQFSDVTGIDVRIDAHIDDTILHDRLAAEVFQMVTEALSNVRRHTRANSVTIRLERVDNTLYIRCVNDDSSDSSNRPFRPRSIADRAEALGGRTHVRSAEGQTTVLVEVPL
ncbi:MAG TPA: histidine kinase [Terriglobia bacterium]|nr:histidine kinase [Terriglobia bacterium]